MNRNDRWLQAWQNSANLDDAFCTMGRSSYSISDYFKYLSDIAKGLGQIKNTDRLLDMAGGAGYIAMYFSPLFSKVDSFDYAPAMIEKSKKECQGFENINVYVDNLLDLSETKRKAHCYEKIILGGALQYFDDYDDIEKILLHLFNVLKPNGQCIATHNTDLMLKQAHIDSYQRLDWSQDKIEHALIAEEDRFWLDFSKVKKIALALGFKNCQQSKIHADLFQSTHMFDFILTK